MVRGGTIAGPDDVIESLERRVFFPEEHNDAVDAARAVEAEAIRRARLVAPGYSRLFRLAVAAWSRAGDARAALRMAEAATRAPETVLDGADAWRMLGTLRANGREWDRAAQAFAESLSRLEAAEYVDGSIHYPSVVGLAGAHRALGRVDEAIRVQEQFLSRFTLSLDSREVQHLIRVLARDHASAGNAARADALAARLGREFPDWGDSRLERVAFRIEIAARRDRATARTDPAYIDRLSGILDAEELRNQPESLLISDEIIRALEAQGRTDEAHRQRLEVLESTSRMEHACGALRSPMIQSDRVASTLLQGMLGRVLADHRSREVMLSEHQLVDVCYLIVDFFPETSMAVAASEILGRVESIDR